MSSLEKRFGRRVNLTLSCRIVTPMFLGNAKQEAELRPEPFKGLLRYWWRIAAGSSYSNYEDLLIAENKIFGGRVSDENGNEERIKSLVVVEVDGKRKQGNDLPKVGNVRHPEVKRKQGINPLLYLGYGPVAWRGGNVVCSRSYLKPEENFKLKLNFPESLLKDEDFCTAIIYFCAFGAVGSRSRNGWGSFQIERITPEELKSKLIKGTKVKLLSYETAIKIKDYPHALGVDKKGKQLIWSTNSGYSSWAEVMKVLAEIYINIRTILPADRNRNVDERHLLGFPLTNHPAEGVSGWGKDARHSSPLRFFVRKKQDGFYGYVLHLPFGISKKMAGSFFTLNRQISIWEKVYKRLDSNGKFRRSNINECL